LLYNYITLLIEIIQVLQLNKGMKDYAVNCNVNCKSNFILEFRHVLLPHNLDFKHYKPIIQYKLFNVYYYFIAAQRCGQSRTFLLHYHMKKYPSALNIVPEEVCLISEPIVYPVQEYRRLRPCCAAQRIYPITAAYNQFFPDNRGYAVCGICRYQCFIGKPVKV